MEVVHTGVELLREEPWTVVLVSVQDKAVSDNSWPSSPFSVEEAAGEALNILFGAGRYGSRILGSVGWKELGESLEEALRREINLGGGGH
jgi:hypothetical protein